MEIVVNSEIESATTKVLFDLASKLKRHHTVATNDWENYENYDLVLFAPEDSDVIKAKKTNPEIIAGIFCAKILQNNSAEVENADFVTVASIEQENTIIEYNNDILQYKMFPEYDYNNKRIHKERDTIRIGYHGNKTHLKHFHPRITGALESLADRYDVELWAIYNIEDSGKWEYRVPNNIDVKHIQWNPDVYNERLSEVDIGIKNDFLHIPSQRAQYLTYLNPLELLFNINRRFAYILKNSLQRLPFLNPSLLKYSSTDIITRYKYLTNAGRIYPFAKVGVPVVADFVPSNAELINHGESGYLTESKRGWEKNIESLIKNPDLREQMATKLANKIERNFSPEENFRRLNRHIKGYN